MDLKTIAETLVAACRAHRESDLLDTIYAADAVSVEAVAPPGGDAVTVGLDGIRAKHAWWNENVDVHSSSVEGPFTHGDDRFAVIFEVDSTMKDSGTRSTFREVAVYTVKDGKIVREQFFYSV
ncbi:nuclear transport factor 2 family protein [Oceaniglobus indicus]|uniref:nuclear transport factor 2 family protein n=1 Tax=Oceaniglobus indicus TaxID=2047749 RepID=UPI000C1826F3|nr:nuclear transport factor 2 family protein [Oceaniglobus indicus]